MPGMDWERVRRETQQMADRRARQQENSPRRAFAAKYRSTCGTCDATIEVGARVASTMVDGKRVYHHERCIYPSDDGAVETLEDLAVILAGAIPDGSCHGVTKAGKPCAGGAKRGELYCGPHLDKAGGLRSTSTTVDSTGEKSAVYGPHHDDPF